MAKIKKESIDFDVTLVKIEFILTGRREKLVINTTATECMEFVDVLNKNRHKTLNKVQKEMMENKYYIFNDYVKKSNVMVSLKDVKYMEIPFFIDTGEEWDMKVLYFSK